MSHKRAADRQLTADNWDDEDDQPSEADGRFAPAPAHVLHNRKIKVAARRRLHPQQQEKKGIFSGFSGFNKSSSNLAVSSAATSFDFISNIVNSKTDESKTIEIPSLSNSTPITKFAGKSSFDSVFTASSASPAIPSFNFIPSSINNKTDKVKAAEVSSPLNSTPKIAERSVFNNMNDFTGNNKVKENEQPKHRNDETSLSFDKQFLKKDDEYYVSLKNLNVSVSEWIKSHVDKNPYCNLTPIFDDYINHLKELDKLKLKSKPVDESPMRSNVVSPKLTNNTDKPIIKNDFSPLPNSSKVSSSPMTSFHVTPKTNEKSDEFKMNNPINTMFGQGCSSTPVSKSPLFPFGQKIESPTPIPFSFGTGKPFTFGNLVPKDAPPAAKAPEEENEEDEPPKVTFTPVVEEDSIFSKRCKIFVKKDDVFGDRGVGTLYLKPIKDSEKYQMIVRADTSLGNLLLNIVLSDIPIQRMGKNNVMLMCIPANDANSPPVPTLLRVKTAEEADKLLETLNKYKK